MTGALLQTQHVDVFSLVTWNCRRTGLDCIHVKTHTVIIMKRTQSTDRDADKHTLNQPNNRGANMSHTHAWSALSIVGVAECGHQDVVFVAGRRDGWMEVLDEPAGVR